MKVLAAVDRSDFAERVVDVARLLAPAHSAEVLILNVAPREPDVLGRQLTRKVITDPVPAELRDRRELLDRLQASLTAEDVTCETLLVRGKPAPTIIAEAERWGADLVIVGSQGRGMLYRQLLGSVAEELLQARRFPLLVVPEPR